jgi:hypothetical protein
MSAVDPYELQCTFDGLELRYLDVEVHAIDTLHFQYNVLAQYLSHSLWYAHRGSGCGVPSRPGDSPYGDPIQRNGLPFRSQCTQPEPSVNTCT